MPEPQVYRNAFGGIVQRYFDAEGNPIGDPASLDDQVGAVFQDSSGNWYKKGANGINIPLPGPPGSGETSEDFNVQLPAESNAAADPAAADAEQPAAPEKPAAPPSVPSPASVPSASRSRARSRKGRSPAFRSQAAVPLPGPAV